MPALASLLQSLHAAKLHRRRRQESRPKSVTATIVGAALFEVIDPGLAGHERGRLSGGSGGEEAVRDSGAPGVSIPSTFS